MAFSVTVRIAANIAIVDVSGRLSILDTLLGERIDSLLTGKNHVVLDLAGLSYIDASGLSQLLSLQKSTQERGGKIALMRPSERVRKLLEVTQLAKVFQIFDDEASTLAGIGGTAPGRRDSCPRDCARHRRLDETRV